MTVDPKTEVYAVFPRLRDRSAGRKTKAIETKYLRLWYDKVVLPSGRQVFGDAVVRHWPLSFQNHVWRDKKYGRQLNARYGVPTGQLYGGIPAMKAFLLAIEEITMHSPDPDVQLLQGVRYVIQRQNEKMNFRQNDIFGTGNNGASAVRDAISAIKESSFLQWSSDLPNDVHIDLGLEMSSRDPSWSPYLMQSCHQEILQWYFKFPEEKAAKKVSLVGRKSEGTEFKSHCTCGLAALASMHYRITEESQKQIRELKCYSTGKGYTYQQQVKYGFQQPAMSSWLSENTSICKYHESLLATLKEAGSRGQSAVRFEWTIPLTRLRSAQIVPSSSIIRKIARIENGAIWCVSNVFVTNRLKHRFIGNSKH